MNAAPPGLGALICAARHAATALGGQYGLLVQIAGDDSPAALAAAHVNWERLRCRDCQPQWCHCDASQAPAEQAYYRQRDGHRHGWMCARCRGITQTG